MLHRVLAIALAFEVINHTQWIGRILSAAVVYDGTVFTMVGLRAAVTALQTSAAWTLWQGLPAATRFAKVSFAASAVLLVLEIGLRLAPSSVSPGLRWPLVAIYGVYAATAIVLLRAPHARG